MKNAKFKRKLYIWVAAIGGVALGLVTVIPIVVYFSRNVYQIKFNSDTRFDQGEYKQYYDIGNAQHQDHITNEQFQTDLKLLTKKQWLVEIAYSIWFANKNSSDWKDNTCNAWVTKVFDFKKHIVNNQIEI
ncbi:MAG: hypothetical protein LBM72_00770, partial [Mycoplasmataceae bacterium]|nr:hypothetical protein [Mycoplasmataceae bacterium]